MWRGGAGFIVAVLVLSGCKHTGETKSTDRNPTGIGAARKKPTEGKDAKENLNPAWLDPSSKLPGADTEVPRGGPWATDPKSPGFNAKAEAQDSVGGKVVDSFNRPAKNVFVRIEAVNGPPGAAPLGIYTDANGYFFTRGLKAGKPYNLTAEATQDGKQLTGSVQTLVPNPVLTIVLREDGAAPITGSTPKPAPTGGGGEAFPPPPLPADGEFIPPMGLGVTGGTTPRPPGDNSFSPGAGATRPVPPTIGTPPGSPRTPTPSPGTGGAIPPPEDLSVPANPSSRPVRPENVAGTPGNPWLPPPVSIPGQPMVPTYPNPPPPSPPPGNSRPLFSLVDTLERPWDFPGNLSGSVVLLEFVTTTCTHCKTAVPVLADLQARLGAEGLQVIAVLCDDLPLKQRVAAAARYGQTFNFPTYVEAGATAGAVRDRFGVEAYPTAVLLDANGKVLWKGHPVGKRRELEAAVRQALGK